MPRKSTAQDIKWHNPKSVVAYGHSVSRHGSKRKKEQLLDRARNTGNDQGQWIDDMFIVEAQKLAPSKPGAHVVEMDKPIGRVFCPDGSIVENVKKARVIRKSDLTVRTSYPIR